MKSGDPPYYRFGWVAFLYGDYLGRVQWINFEKQKFWPEHPPCDGYKYSVKPGTEGIFVAYKWRLDTDPVAILGNVISAKMGDWSGLRQVGPDGLRGPSPTWNPL